jgi:anti-sigma factor RsiW
MSGPIDCAAVRDQIERYVDRELEAVECEAIERHCAECAPCAALVRQVRDTIGLCRDVGHAPLPEPVRARAHEHVKRLLAGLNPAAGPPSD